MTGVPIYLVSACTTGEEFVSAFRRYADRGSVFVPIAEPIPAGRRGRFALTLAGGGVLIEGDAEVISSSKTPSVLHGRIGMTIRFADLDDASKTVLIELEKARLVSKPPAPSIAPRVVELPAGPRPVPPTASVRIDASVALAECTALGDLDQLEKAVATPPKAGPKFVVPTVPPVGAPRPRTPSTPPELRPRTPSGPQPIVRPKSPSLPPPMPSLSPLPKTQSGPTKVPTGTASDTMPAIQTKEVVGGFSATMPAVSIADLKAKVPLDVALANAAAEIDAPKTTTMDAPPAPVARAREMTPRERDAIKTPALMDVPPAPAERELVKMTPTEIAAVVAPKTAAVMDIPPAPIMTPTQMAAVEPPTSSEIAAATTTMTPTQMAAVPPPPNSTAILQTVAPTRPARDDATSPSPIRVAAAARREEPTPARPTRVTPPPTPTAKTPEWMLTTVRGTAPPPTPVPAPPIIGHPPVKPLDPDVDEPTDLTAMPIIPDDSRKTALGVAAIMQEPAAIITDGPPFDPSDVDDAPVEIDDIDTSVTEQPSDMRAIPMSEIHASPPNVEEPTPSGDWTITPGASPTIEPRKPAVEGELQPVPQAKDDEIKAPPVRITGNWTIQLDSSSPDGWSEPSKVDIAPITDEDLKAKPKPKKERTKPTPETPPELRPVARSIIMEALPAAPSAPVTPSLEPKVQIDPTLMDAPIVDPNFGAGASASMPAVPAAGQPTTLSALMPAQPDPSAQLSAQISAQMPVMQVPVEHRRLATPIPGSMSPMVPIDRPTPTPLGLDPRVTPLPGSMMAPPFPPISPADLVALPTPVPGRLVTDGGVGFFRDSGEIANLQGSGSFPIGDSTSLIEARHRRRLLVIGISAGVVVALGIVLVIALAGGGKKAGDDHVVQPPPPADAGTGPGSADRVVVVAPADAAAVVAPPPVKDAAEVEPPTATCAVEVTTVPAGAEVLLQGSKQVLGTTPATLSLPCGTEAKLLVRKLRFGNVTRLVTATAAGAKVRIALQKLMYSVKVSSSPAGATISINGKSVAATPTTMKLPAFELTTVTFSKDGYNVESFKVTPKQNNQTVHAQLKRKPKR